jgi:nitroreductase
MTTNSAPGASRRADAGQAPPDLALDERMQALEDAADAAMAAPSVHNSQPWTLVVHRDRLERHADRSRRLPALDPDGRELVQSLGAALFNMRVALAGRGWAGHVERFPDAGRPDLAAVVHPERGTPDDGLAPLVSVVHRRRTNRRGFLAEEVPDELLDHLVAAAAAEDTSLVPVVAPGHRSLIARLTREAEAVQEADPACAADLDRWRPEPVERSRTDSASGADRSFVLLATRADDARSWLRSGEALGRVLLVLSRLGWAAGPMSQALEVARTRARLRAGITGDQHPQMLLRIGFAASTADAVRRRRDDVVRNSSRGPRAPGGPSPAVPRPVPDGRGGTTWL